MLEKEDRDGITVLRLAHGKASAFDLELAREITRTLDEVVDSAAPAVVLTGTGSIFSAGVDLMQLIEGGAEYVKEFLPAVRLAFDRRFFFPKPVVAAVNGHAIAGGGICVLAADHRIMATGKGRIGVPELLVGVPFPPLGLEIVRFALPPTTRAGAIHRGKNYTAGDAHERGFVDEICEPDDLLPKAESRARELARLPAEAFRLTKEQLRRPVRDFLERHGPELDAAVDRSWQDPATLERVRLYVDETIHKKKQK